MDKAEGWQPGLSMFALHKRGAWLLRVSGYGGGRLT